MTGELYRSGSRLKIRWVKTGASPARYLPIAIFDAKLGRVCELGHDGQTHACLPVVDETVFPEDLAFLGAKLTEPALLVDDEECGSAASEETERRIWSGSLMDLHRLETTTLWALEPPCRAKTAWVAPGSGCTVMFTEAAHDVCVRPFRPVDLSDVVTIEEVVLGRPGDPSGVIVARGSDGSILPLANGPEYRDAKNGIRCSISAEESRCLPKRPSLGSLPPDRPVEFPSRFEGAGHLARRVRTMPDGRIVPVSFYDTRLERDCTPEKMDDGRWRCVVPPPRTCVLTRVRDSGEEKEALSPRRGECKDSETCCTGGVTWLPGRPAQRPRRFGGDDPIPYGRPAVPGRAVRFADTPRLADRLRHLQPHIRALVYEMVEELEPGVFAEIELVQDP